MPIQHAVLALLGDGPSHGYELKSAFEQAIGPQWGPLNIGHLYQVLDRLSRDGLVSSTRVAQEVKPDRVVYAITDAGAAELTGWLAEPSPRTAGFRDDFFLKVMAAARTHDPAVVKGVLGTQRTFLLRELRNLDQLRREPGTDLVVGLLLAAAVRHVEADLAFLDDAEQVLRATPRAAPARSAAEPRRTDPAVRAKRRARSA